LIAPLRGVPDRTIRNDKAWNAGTPEASLLVAFCYLGLRLLLRWLALRVRSKDSRELGILVQRHELAIFGVGHGDP
jgi:hypothetical protein